MDAKRELARELARRHAAAGDPLGWFEALYQHAGGDFDVIPWADRVPNPHLTGWCERESLPRPASDVLVVGCGLGDDAEYLAARGADVTAIDLSPTAIEWCRRRFPSSPVDYRAADLLQFEGPEFDLIVEIYTLQAMPLDLRAPALARLVQLGREILIICRGRDESDPPGQLPIPLTRTDLAPLEAHGFSAISFEDFDDTFDPGQRRFRVFYRR